MALTKEARLEGSAKSILAEVEEECQNLRAIQQAARKNANMLQAISASRALRGWTELKARITDELDERPQVTINLQQTKEWIQVQTVVLKFVDEKLGEKDRDELTRRLRVVDGRRG